MVLRRLAAEYAVDDGAGLGACDPVFRFERAVGIALNQTAVLCCGDVRGEPVGRLHISEVAVDGGAVCLREAHGDLGEFRARDRCVRTEGAVGVTAEDAHMTERGNGVVVPLVGAHVGEVILGRPVPLAGIVGQQAEEDRCDLRTGDPAVRADRTVLIADDIGHMVVLVQGRNCIGRNDDVVRERNILFPLGNQRDVCCYLSVEIIRLAIQGPALKGITRTGRLILRFRGVHLIIIIFKRQMLHIPRSFRAVVGVEGDLPEVAGSDFATHINVAVATLHTGRVSVRKLRHFPVIEARMRLHWLMAETVKVEMNLFFRIRNRIGRNVGHVGRVPAGCNIGFVVIAI